MDIIESTEQKRSMCLKKGKVQRFRWVGWAVGNGHIGGKIQMAMTRCTQTGRVLREWDHVISKGKGFGYST